MSLVIRQIIGKGTPAEREIVVGNLTDAGIWKKQVRGSKHFLFSPPGICFSRESIDDYRPSIRGFQVTDRETGTVYQATAETFFGAARTVKRANTEEQYLLPMGYWSIKGKGQSVPASPLRNAAEALVTQAPKPAPAPVTLAMDF